jgi:hypothetical protein
MLKEIILSFLRYYQDRGLHYEESVFSLCILSGNEELILFLPCSIASTPSKEEIMRY